MLRLFLLILCLVSCSSDPKVNSRSNLDNVYISNGVEGYFLGELPNWANFSSSGKCQRTSEIYYLNFENLSRSYALNYEQMINLQQMFNKNLTKSNLSTAQAEHRLKEQSFTFLNAYELIIGGSRDFKTPNFQKMNLFWIDPYLANKKKMKEVIKSDEFLASYPVLASTCLTNSEMISLAEELGVDNLGALYISAEMFSIFGVDEENKVINNFRYGLDLNALLPGKDLTLFSNTIPDDFTGKFNQKKIK